MNKKKSVVFVAALWYGHELRVHVAVCVRRTKLQNKYQSIDQRGGQFITLAVPKQSQVDYQPFYALQGARGAGRVLEVVPRVGIPSLSAPPGLGSNMERR
jgi:hypothetical protein